MAFNKDKVLKKAETLAGRGRIEPAIKEFKKILSKEGEDENILNRIGDLYKRIRKNDEAIQYWSKTSDLYENRGFYLKAIAVQKKIQRIDPGSLTSHRKLAELYHQQGLKNDARGHYQYLVDHYLRTSEGASAIAIYQKLIEIEPDNPTHRAKLAELYKQQRLTSKAIEEYVQIARLMINHKELDQAVQVYAKAVEVDSSDVAFLRNALMSLREAGSVGHAEELLRKAVSLNPDAADLRSLIDDEPPPERVPTQELIGRGLDDDRPAAREPVPGANTGGFELIDTGQDDLVDSGMEVIQANETGFAEVAPPEPPIHESIAPEPTPIPPPTLNTPIPTPAPQQASGPSTEIDFDEFVIDFDDDQPSTLVEPPPDLAGTDIPGLALSGAFEMDDVEITLGGVALDPDSESQNPESQNPESPSSELTSSSPTSPELTVSDGQAPFELDLEGPDELEFGESDLEAFDLQGTEVAPPSASDTLPPTGAVEPMGALPEFPGGEDDSLMGLHEMDLDFGLDSPAEPELPSEPAPVELQSDGFESFEPAPPPVQHQTTPPPEVDHQTLAPSAPLVDELSAPSAPPLEASPVAPTAPPPAPAAPPPVAAPVAEAADDSASQAALAMVPDDIQKVNDLLAEAEVFVKYGLNEKAVDRLNEVLSMDPSHLGAATQLIRLQLDRGEYQAVAPVFNGLFDEVQETGALELWDELKSSLIEHGYTLDGERIASLPGGLGLDGQPVAAPEVEPLEPLAASDAIAPIDESAPMSVIDVQDIFEEPHPTAHAETPAAPVAPPARGGPAAAGPAGGGLVDLGELGSEIDAEIAAELSGSASHEAIGSVPPAVEPAPDIPEQTPVGDDAAQPSAPAPPPPAAEPAAPPVAAQSIDPLSMVESANGAPPTSDALQPGLAWLNEQETSPVADSPEAVLESDEDALFSDEDQFFDLAAELQSEMAPDTAISTPVTPEEQSLEEIVEGFKKGVAENLSSEDYDTHYNLGIAYREMMLLDEAIGEFQIAAKSSDYLVDCCAMLGLCFRDKGLPDLAMKWYQRAIDSGLIDEDRMLGMLYEMGSVYLERNDRESAYKTFVEIYGMNTNYRDVASKMADLAPVG